MKDKDSDIRMRDEINNLPGLPPGVSWTENKGWEQYVKKHRNSKSLHLVRWTFAAAAMLLIVIVLRFNLFQKTNPDDWVELGTGPTEKKELVLWDGSKIWLNGNSAVKVDTKRKTVRLEGEVYFEFANKYTYSLTSPHGKILTQGGHFNMKSRPGDQSAMLSVAQGRVTILWEIDARQKMIVNSGMGAKIIPQVAIVMIPDNDPNYLAWKTGELHFSNTPMYCVINKLEELNNTKIDITNNNIRYCRISSDFNTLDVRPVLQVLTKYLHYKMKFENNSYLIIGDGCNI